MEYTVNVDCLNIPLVKLVRWGTGAHLLESKNAAKWACRMAEVINTGEPFEIITAEDVVVCALMIARNDVAGLEHKAKHADGLEHVFWAKAVLEAAAIHHE